MQIWAESGKSALPICNYSQILYQFLTFTQNLKRSLIYFPYKVPAASIPKRFPRPCYELPTKISAILEAK